MRIGRVRGVVGVLGVDFSTPFNSALIRSFGQKGRKNFIVALKTRTSELGSSTACCPARYARSWSFNTANVSLKKGRYRCVYCLYKGQQTLHVFVECGSSHPTVCSRGGDRLEAVWPPKGRCLQLSGLFKSL